MHLLDWVQAALMGGDLTRAGEKFNGRPSLWWIYSVNLLYKVEMACCLIRYDLLEVYVLFHGPSGQEKGFNKNFATFHVYPS